MKCTGRNLLLYAVTDRSWLQGNTLYDQVERAIRGGVTFVQLREKSLDKNDFLREAREIGELCRQYQVPMVINDSVEIALAADADGVHLGQKDMGAAEARELLGPEKIIGVSARTLEQALLAEENGADYLGVGAAFPTGSKNDAKTISHETLQAICKAVKIPVVAIGGISPLNVTQLSGSGISGIAVISALFAQPDIGEAARKLRKLAEQVSCF